MARIVIASGGTGGHFYPGFSLAQALRRKGHEALFLVRTGDAALPLLERSGFAALPLDVTGLPRRPGPKLLSFAWKMGGAVRLLRRAFRAWKPDALVGMGAYLTFPGVAAARSLGVPVLLHESNAAFGLANRVCSNVAQKVCLGLPMNGSSTVHRSPSTVLTGTPIREALWSPIEPGAARLALGLEREKTTVLVFGGSQGASKLNAAAPEALAAASEAAGGLQVLHLAGAKDAGFVAAAYKAVGVNAVVLPYLESMELAFGAADLVVSRSGASTLAELIAQTKPALLIPYPHATGGHQEINARRLEKAGAADVLLESALTTRSLSDKLVRLLGAGRSPQLAGMRQAYAKLKIPTGKDAVEALVSAVEGLL